jgi:hypothetical protein
MGYIAVVLMNREFKILIGLGKIAFIISDILVIAFYLWLPDICGYYFHSESTSPNGKFKALIFPKRLGCNNWF